MSRIGNGIHSVPPPRPNLPDDTIADRNGQRAPRLDPDPRSYGQGYVDGIRAHSEVADDFRRSSSKVVLLALGVGAALGFVAGWVAR